MIAVLAALIGRGLARVWGILAAIAAAVLIVLAIAWRARRDGVADTLNDIERASRERTVNHHDLRSRIEARHRRAGAVSVDERLRSPWVAPR